MMTTTALPLRNAAFCIPIAVVLGALWGAEHAVGAAVASGLMVLNLWVLSVLGPRVVSSLARQQSPILWFVVLGAKFVVVSGILLALVRVFPPVSVALGFVPLVLGTLITGIMMAQEEARREASDPNPIADADDGADFEEA